MSVILLIAASDLVVYRLVDVACLAFQSVERLAWTANLNVFASLMRLAGIAAVLLAHRPTVVAWSVAYLATSAVCALVAVYCVFSRLARPTFSGLGRLRAGLREGFYFSTSLSAQTIYNDVDKTMLARLATLDAAGIYAAAYRLIDMAFMPVRALLAAAYPSFFRRGNQGIGGSLSFARELLPKPLVYSAAVAAGLALGAPLVPLILGADYARTTEALRWLSLLPLLKTCHYFAADALTGAGHQGLRTLLQVARRRLQRVDEPMAHPGLLLAGRRLEQPGLRRTARGGAVELCARSAGPFGAQRQHRPGTRAGELNAQRSRRLLCNPDAALPQQRPYRLSGRRLGR